MSGSSRWVCYSGYNFEGLKKPLEKAVNVKLDTIARLEMSFPGEVMIIYRLLFPVLILEVIHARSEHPLTNEITLGAGTNTELEGCPSLVTPRYKSNLRIKISLNKQVFGSHQEKITIPQHSPESRPIVLGQIRGLRFGHKTLDVEMVGKNEVPVDSKNPVVVSVQGGLPIGEQRSN